jgi:hypothetical protein
VVILNGEHSHYWFQRLLDRDQVHDSECSKICIVARLADALPQPKLHFRMKSFLAVGVYSADGLVEFTHKRAPWFSACLDGAGRSSCSGWSTSYESASCCWASPGHRMSSERYFAFRFCNGGPLITSKVDFPARSLPLQSRATGWATGNLVLRPLLWDHNSPCGQGAGLPDRHFALYVARPTALERRRWPMKSGM